MKSLYDHKASIMRRLTRHRRFPLLLRRRGAQFILDPRNWLDAEIALRTGYEEPQIRRAVDFVRTERLSLFVDVGANLGLYTVLLGRLPEIAHVIAFEPVHRTFNQLCANVFANRLDGKVTARNVALGDTNADAIMHIDPRSSVVARFVPTFEGRAERDFAERETVKVARFDSIESVSGARAFVKIDVEGHAAHVVQGMQRFLSENFAILQVEVFAEEHDAVFDKLARLGYTSHGSIGRDHYFRIAA